MFFEFPTQERLIINLSPYSINYKSPCLDLATHGLSFQLRDICRQEFFVVVEMRDPGH